MHLLGCLFVVVLSALFSKSAVAGCLDFSQNERLSNFCLLEELKGKEVDPDIAAELVNRLKREGYFGGLNEPSWSTIIYPTFDRSRNINGGEPNKRITIGDLEVHTEPEFARQTGLITSVNLATSNRVTFDEGKYLQTDLNASYSYSPEHDNGYSDFGFNSCLKNKLEEATFLDLCSSAQFQRKKLSEYDSKSISLRLTNITHSQDNGSKETGIGIIHKKNKNYSQNQVSLSWDKINSDDYFMSADIRFGMPVKNTSVFKYGIELGFFKVLRNKKYSLNLIHEMSAGGQFFGIPLEDIENTVRIQTTLGRNLILTAGYTALNSSVDYYDESYPSIHLTFNW